ncbi:DALR anticodon-binding domain-containing protein 3 isoform X7 [Halichoerus grypus]
MPGPDRAGGPRGGSAGTEGRKRPPRFPLAHLSAQGPPPDTRPGQSALPEARPLDVLLPVPLAPSGRHGDGALGGRGDPRGPQHGPGAWRPRVVQGDARPPPARPRLPGAAARAASALRGRTGARACGPCGRRPARPRRGPGAALRADARGSGTPAAAARRLRARARRRGRLCRARRARRARPARPPALPSAARRSRRAPLEPAARRARGRSFGASSARAWQLRVDWPAASERAATEALRSLALAELSPARDGGALPPGVLGTVCLKEVMQERGRAAGYDPNLDKCLVTEDLLCALAELQEAVRHGPGDGPPGLAAAPDADAGGCMVVHVVSCEEEFQQQKLDLLWWKLDEQAPLTQKHLVCGPVKAAGAPGALTAPEYYEPPAHSSPHAGSGTPRCARRRPGSAAGSWPETRPGWRSSAFSLWRLSSSRCSAQPRRVSSSWPWPAAAFPQRAPRAAPSSCTTVPVLPRYLRGTSTARNKVGTPLFHL